MRVVIVGASLGGLRTAEALRKAKFAGELVVVGAEPHLPYSRPPLSKEVLAGGVTHEAVAFPLRKAVADVQWRLSTTAVAADLTARTIALADGTALPYDGLVLATGLRSRRLHVPGPPAGPDTNRYALRTLEDAASLRARLQPGVRVVVVGAGFIGSEVAATARTLGCDVTCVAVDPQPMVVPLGELLGAELAHRHEAKGVRFRLGTGIARMHGEREVTGVELATGEVLAADVVVEAVGSEPNVQWLAGTGLDVKDGVLADNALRAVRTDGTAVDGVHVVGDLARFPNPLFDDVPRRVEHWNMPTETGRRAGTALAAYLAGDGYDTVLARRFAPLPAFWSDQYEIRLQSFGLPGLGERAAVLEGELHDEVVVGYHRGEQLVGVAGLGMLPRVLEYRAHIGS